MRSESTEIRSAYSNANSAASIARDLGDAFAETAPRVIVFFCAHTLDGEAISGALRARFPAAEIIRHEMNGLLAADGDLTSLAESLDRVMTDDALRQRLADEAQNVREQFSVERYFTCKWNVGKYIS